jgi:hypothetical protein
LYNKLIRFIFISLVLVAFHADLFREGAFSNTFSLLPYVWAGNVNGTGQGEKNRGSGIELPPLETDEDKLKFLIWIKNRIPNLFSDAAQYDIDLMAILDDQKKLVDILKTYPGYEEAFRSRKYVELTLTPPPEGIEVNQVQLKPGVVRQWKEKLENTLDQWAQGSHSQQGSITEALLAEVKKTLLSESKESDKQSGQAASKTFATLQQIIGIKDRLGKEPYNYSQKASLVDKLAVVEKILSDHPEIQVGDALRSQLNRLLISERNKVPVLKSKDLAELYLALRHAERNGQPSQQAQDARQSLSKLSVLDLQYFSDQHDVLQPAVENMTQGLFNNDHKKKTALLNGLVSNIQHFTSQTEKKVIKATEPVILKEVTPREAIFRGCTGGDCSSQYSFPYPNDPHERVFFIYDKNEKLKGYVSSTEVEVEGKKSLYVITISGNRVNAGDTEIVLLGLDQAQIKKELGVSQIILPNSENILDLINFMEIRGVYQKHVEHKKTIPIKYYDQFLRLGIEKFKSDNNTHDYDHMKRNNAGVILSEDHNNKIQPENVKVREIELPSEPFKDLHLTQGEALEFALDMNYLGRDSLVNRIIKLQGIDKKTFNHVLKLLENPEHDTVEQFYKELSKTESSWGISFQNKEYLLRCGLINASNAFGENHIENTAKWILKEFEEYESTDYVDEIESYRDHLNETKAYKKHSAKLLTQFDPNNFEDSMRALDRDLNATQVYINEDFRKWIEKGLLHNDVKVRESAAVILRNYRGRDAHLLFEIVFNNKNEDPIVYEWALESIQVYEGYWLNKLKSENKLLSILVSLLVMNTPYARQASLSMIEEHYPKFFAGMDKERYSQLRKYVGSSYKQPIHEVISVEYLNGILEYLKSPSL